MTNPTPHTSTEAGGPANLTARELLKMYDDLMGTNRMLTAAERDAIHTLLGAACFAAAAYEASADRDAAPGAMMLAFLVALVDPMDARLDCFRADPEAAKASRETRP